MTALCSGKICTIFPEKGALNFWKACTIALEYSEDENPKPIDVMKCLLPEIEKCAENYPELKKIVDMMYEKEIIFCLSEIDNLKRKLHR